MNDVFLQSIIEKLEALEIALLKRDNSTTISDAQQPIVNQLKSCQCGIEICLRDFRNLNARIEALSLRLPPGQRAWMKNGKTIPSTITIYIEDRGSP
jgi:hypothetical protein